MKRLFTLILLFTYSSLFAQIGFFNGLNTNQFQKLNIANALTGGLPFSLEDNAIVQGSPFLREEFTESFVQLRDDKFYSGIKLRFNLETNKVHYQDLNRKEMVALDGIIKRFYMKTFDGSDSVSYMFGCGYPESPGTTPYTYFQEYNFGKANFLRLVSKSVVERKTLATVDPVKQYDEKDSYYVYNGTSNKLIKWRKGKDFILDMLADKATEVMNFINEKKLGCKSTEDIILIIQYYNNLFVK